ncbi:hypothetical protein GLIP_4273 [Aliiglaciecola lipolytica E3]|uniref:ArnT-like N-terminal domain-containing protein n=1 Tax=Aliiglaciecola lipolytica E3 TaxID=1127673 RepID=K6X8E5_9ALTE|nr:hypothetical protein GLIP_4273 [Aliiglaciecola lipolytica E3]
MDTTEARYGEIARIMLETQNWITPQFDYGVPFWGKPPLHTWASAISASILGVSEFSLRLPHLLAGAFTLFVLSILAKGLQLNAKVVVLLTCSMLGFYASSGMVMTDAFLLLGITLALGGFALTWAHTTKVYAYIGFIGLGIGLLAKGPITIVLIGLVIVPWLGLNYGVKKGLCELVRRIPVLSGLILMLAVSLPWYVLAERATPGFFNYFIVGEHWLRFVQSGWEGDLYGTAHSEPRGIIWLYWVLIAFPWSIYLSVILTLKKNRIALKEASKADNWTSYFVLWLISPMILFTFSGNILAIYVLPGIPALALLIARIHTQITRPMILISLITPVLLVVFLFAEIPDLIERKSDKGLVESVKQTYPIYAVNKPSFSSRFYTQGKIKTLTSILDLKALNKPAYIIVPNNVKNAQALKSSCTLQSQNALKALFLCP